jgi:hypothetical protein
MRSVLFYGIAAGIALGIAMAPKAVAIRVSPQVVMVNGSIQITCVVEPSDQNRQLTAGLRFYSASGRSLDGAHSQKTWVFPRLVTLPCPETDDRYVAYCSVLRNDDSVIDATATVLVSGCAF